MRSGIRLLLGLAMSALGVTPAAPADDATAVYTATYVEVVPPSTAQGTTLLRQYRGASRKEPGNLRIEVLERIDRPNQFTVLSAWKDPEAFEAHAAAAAARDLRAKLAPLLASPSDERVHQGLAVGAAPPMSTAGSIHVVTHVDVIPPRKEDGVALLRQLAADSSKDAGNVRFDVLQQTNRPNHFTVVEAWKDRDAFDAHGMAAHTRQFRDRLAPMSGALYDERLYMILD
jgi:quinol monooxygenase YgiN